VHAGEENHARSGWTTSRRGQDHGVKSDMTPRGRVNQYDRGQRLMEKVRPLCAQALYRGRLKNRTEHACCLAYVTNFP